MLCKRLNTHSPRLSIKTPTRARWIPKCPAEQISMPNAKLTTSDWIINYEWVTNISALLTYLTQLRVSLGWGWKMIFGWLPSCVLFANFAPQSASSSNRVIGNQPQLSESSLIWRQGKLFARRSPLCNPSAQFSELTGCQHTTPHLRCSRGVITPGTVATRTIFLAPCLPLVLVGSLTTARSDPR